MKRPALTLIILFCFWLASPVAAFAGRDNWTSVRSKNFFLVGNASEKEILEAAMRLEQFRAAFARLFNQVRLNSPVPVTVVVFKNETSYEAFKPGPDISGYFQASDDVNYITLAAQVNGQQNPYRIIFHEYVHLLVNNTLGASAPPWFNEGLAEYYSTFDVRGDYRRVTIGRPIASHLLTLRRQELIPLRTLFKVDYNSLGHDERGSRSLFYAESWALMHYLMQGDEGQRITQLEAFFKLLAEGRSTEEAFRQSFKTDFATFEQELKNYIQAGRFNATDATLERKLEPDTEMHSEPVSEAAAQAYLGDLLLHIQRPVEAEARLQQALRLDPQLAFAHASLGILRVRQQRLREARESLERAIAADSRSYLVHYYYAYTLSREGMDETQTVSRYTEQAARRMRAELQQAIELKPDYAEAYHLLAFVNLVMEERLDQSVELIKHALALSPGRQDYLLILAQIYLRMEDFKSARNVLEPLTRAHADTSLRERAVALLKSANYREAELARYRSSRDEAGLRLKTVDERSPETDDAPATFDEKKETQLALQRALRQAEAGEERVRAQLLNIDCAESATTFDLKIGERVIKLHANALTKVRFRTYTTGVGQRISCGQRTPANAVVIIYRPSPDTRTRTDGELLSVEFVPEDFELSR